MNVSPPLVVTCCRKKLIMSSKFFPFPNVEEAFRTKLLSPYIYHKNCEISSYFHGKNINVFQLFSYPQHFLEQQNQKGPSILVLEIENIECLCVCVYKSVRVSVWKFPLLLLIVDAIFHIHHASFYQYIYITCII